jgi:DNA processing protein
MKYQYWLSNIPGVGCKTIHRLLGQAGSAEEIYFLKKEQLEKLAGLSDRQVLAITERKMDWDLEEKYAKLGENGTTFLSYEMDSYPEQLRNIVDAPYSLYVKGKLPDFSKKRVAIVGARMCSDYGKTMAERIAEKLACCGAEVISGMARGIDAYGHIGALKAGGDTFAVLGCGVNVCYPRTNQKLYESILAQGGIISEYPPDTEPIAQLFPARNRIISALSDVVVVVEAKERSGSLITADFALEQGKDIYAVPGRSTDTLSQGCNNLIRQGAGILNSVEDFAKDLELCMKVDAVQENFNKLLLEKDESLVYACLSLRPKSMEDLLKKTGFPMPQLADILQRLIQKDFITESFKNYYIRKI